MRAYGVRAAKFLGPVQEAVPSLTDEGVGTISRSQQKIHSLYDTCDSCPKLQIGRLICCFKSRNNNNWEHARTSMHTCIHNKVLIPT